MKVPSGYLTLEDGVFVYNRVSPEMRAQASILLSMREMNNRVALQFKKLTKSLQEAAYQAQNFGIEMRRLRFGNKEWYEQIVDDLCEYSIKASIPNRDDRLRAFIDTSDFWGLPRVRYDNQVTLNLKPVFFRTQEQFIKDKIEHLP